MTLIVLLVCRRPAIIGRASIVDNLVVPAPHLHVREKRGLKRPDVTAAKHMQEEAHPRRGSCKNKSKIAGIKIAGITWLHRGPPSSWAPRSCARRTHATRAAA